MKQELFQRHYEADWQRLTQILFALDHHQNLSPEDAERFPVLYRSVCKQLSLARDRNYSAHVVDLLNQLVLRGHHRFYQPKSTAWQRLWRFLWFDFPKAVRAEYRLFWLCALLFFGPLLGMVAWIDARPEIAYSVLSPEQLASYEMMYRPGNRLERDETSDILMFGYYIRNNVGIGFRTFASGLFFGIGSVFFLLLNGLVIGAVAGHIFQLGYQDVFLPFVAGHGSLELTAIVLAGVAGLKLGMVLVRPGPLTRSQALKLTSRKTLPMVYGMALMLILAAMVEAFWSPAPFPAQIKYAVGIGGWVAVALYFWLAGRSHGH